jgi:hypothetical protein
MKKIQANYSTTTNPLVKNLLDALAIKKKGPYKSSIIHSKQTTIQRKKKDSS